MSVFAVSLAPHHAIGEPHLACCGQDGRQSATTVWPAGLDNQIFIPGQLFGQAVYESRMCAPVLSVSFSPPKAISRLTVEKIE